jgi:hypothetical protein
MMKGAIAAVLFCLLSAGVATAASPSYENLAKLPVIEFGEPVPSGDYILLFPAGKPVTISVSIEGSLFSRTAATELTVAPSKQIMVFKEWASLDGVNWVPRGELIRSDVLVKIPGYNHPHPGQLKVQMDLAGTR